jgi:hypothetical protein
MEKTHLAKLNDFVPHTLPPDNHVLPQINIRFLSVADSRLERRLSQCGQN